jgi:asparagine N-glycosylation enzyme membrane subunit Stt3
VALGSSLRAYQIGGEGLWIDEAFSIWLARRPWGEMVRWVATVDQHPPLYYTLLHGWIRIFGDGEVSARALSALFGTLTLAVVYLLGRRLADEKVGLVSALVLAVSPFHVRFGQEARMYTLLTLSGSLAMYAFIELLENNNDASVRARGVEAPVPIQRDGRGGGVPSGRGSRSCPKQEAFDARPKSGASGPRALAWIGYVIFTATMLWTHNTAIFLPMALNLFILGRSLIERHFCSSVSVPTSPLASWRRHWLLAQMAVVLLWLPWLPAFVAQAAGVYRRFWLPAPTLGTVLSVISEFLCAFLPLPLPGILAVDIALFAVLLVGIRRLRPRPAHGALLGTVFVIPLLTEWVVSLWRPILYARTLIWISIPLYLMLAVGLRGIEARLPSRTGCLAALIVLLAGNGLALHNYYEHFEKEEWDDAAAVVAQHVQPDDVLLFNDAWGQIPFDYYFRRLYNGPVVEHGLPVDLFDRGVLEPRMTERDLSRVSALIRGRERVWLVYSHDWYTDPQGLVPGALEEKLSVLDGWDFYGLRVLLYRCGEGCGTE